MNAEQNYLYNWLKVDCNLSEFRLESMPYDASFRRYYRLSVDSLSYVVMDASLEKSCLPAFIAISDALRSLGILAPEVIHKNLQLGYLLISDFGDTQLLGALNTNNVENLYSNALSSLDVLQSCSKVDGYNIPLFTKSFMYNELKLFKEWFLQKYLGLNLSIKYEKLLDNTFIGIVEKVNDQPKVFMHRDYHSANLMILPQNKIGVLDFQDAFIGPITYDLVSLLRDCYISWPRNLIVDLVLNYKSNLNLNISDDLFLNWFDCMSLQRHMKTLLTFSRKNIKDSNPNYLKHIPRTLNYISDVITRYKEFEEFKNFFNNDLYPSYKKVELCEE
ncbi:phosphotransferase [Gammaproteobacteria bacterium]|nr:phosphotransferase [Gammaproteobacteria bacterium]